MGSDSQLDQIPVIKFSIGSPDMDRGTEGWHHLCKRVREACENYGFFEVVYDKISMQSRAETFSVMREFFGLPLETKEKNVSPKPYHGYFFGQNTKLPLYESFGIEDASNYDSIQSFVELMWPNGHDQFCQNVNPMMKHLDELYHTIEMMILGSYGLGEKLDSIIPNNTLLRVMKYRAPPSGEYMLGLHAHTDKLSSVILCQEQVSGVEVETKDGQWVKLSPSSVILCQEQVSGVEVETKDGQWVKLSPSPSSFIFIVGDPLMVWSNGRMHAVKHRVVLRGDKERYSFGAFVAPLDGTIIKAPKELVDEEHPQVFKEIDFTDFLRFSYTEKGRSIDSEKQMFAYSGN